LINSILIGNGQAPSAIGSAARGYLGATNAKQDALYESSYPHALFEAIGTLTIDARRSVGLLPADSGREVAAAMSNSWRRLLDDPATYGDWESKTVDDLAGPLS
jgi:hypothetical protein